MLPEETKTRIRGTIARLTCYPQDLAYGFYDRLFERAPETRALFKDDIGSQADKLMDTLMVVVQSLNKLAGLVTFVEALGRQHARHGVTDDMYPVVGDVLIDTVAENVEDWSEADRAAWYELYNYLSDLMITGARDVQTPVPEATETPGT